MKIGFSSSRQTGPEKSQPGLERGLGRDSPACGQDEWWRGRAEWRGRVPNSQTARWRQRPQADGPGRQTAAAAAAACGRSQFLQDAKFHRAQHAKQFVFSVLQFAGCPDAVKKQSRTFTHST